MKHYQATHISVRDGEIAIMVLPVQMWFSTFSGRYRKLLLLLLIARAKQIEAEAKLLRAWFHFEANKVFENIPYIKTQTELGTVLPEMVPNTDPGWTGIEEDLQYAIDNLPTTKINDEAGRANQICC